MLRNTAACHSTFAENAQEYVMMSGNSEPKAHHIKLPFGKAHISLPGLVQRYEYEKNSDDRLPWSDWYRADP